MGEKGKQIPSGTSLTSMESNFWVPHREPRKVTLPEKYPLSTTQRLPPYLQVHEPDRAAQRKLRLIAAAVK